MTQQSKQLRRFNRLVGETDAVYHELANRLGLSDSAFQILYDLIPENQSILIRQKERPQHAASLCSYRKQCVSEADGQLCPAQA